MCEPLDKDCFSVPGNICGHMAIGGGDWVTELQSGRQCHLFANGALHQPSAIYKTMTQRTQYSSFLACCSLIETVWSTFWFCDPLVKYTTLPSLQPFLCIPRWSRTKSKWPTGSRSPRREPKSWPRPLRWESLFWGRGVLFFLNLW